MTGSVLLILLTIIGAAIAIGVAIALIVVAAKLTGSIFQAIFWLIGHLFTVVGGVIKDVARLVSALVAAVVLLPLAAFNVVLARWPSAGRMGRSLKRELLVVGYSIYSLGIRRPMQLLGLRGVMDGLERRNDPGASVGPTTASIATDTPLASADPGRRGAAARNGSHFEGYEIEGTLRPGGSGAKLYIASPTPANRRSLVGSPEKVVLKSFALEEGSSLPQIVRESRALDAARALGLVLDHGLDDGRFWYAMPYHPGENLNETTRYLHARAGAGGLAGETLAEAMGYVADLVATISRYHDGGLWHKDVKPDNIIVHGGRAHLVDLGLVTPLRSAMTLTTHGTEYFRDPEMVRQALRGVRVHQVDGAKFDVYGAGAVLYFVLENTFPAHGGLSAFSKRSPEALRWIVRRAMADYHQRYSTARAMQLDLEAVARASDPWGVRPVDLPSMRGADMDAATPPMAGAGTWMPPHSPIGVGAGMGLGAAGAAVAVAPMAPYTGRPRLKVLNWWSGTYGPTDAAVAVAPLAPPMRVAPPQPVEIDDKARDASVADAEARKAVAEHRRRTPRACSTTSRRARHSCSRVGSYVGLALPAVVLAVVLTKPEWKSQRSATPVAARVAVSPTDALIERASPPAKLAPPIEGAKLIVLNEHPGRGSADVDSLVDRIETNWTSRGFALVAGSPEVSAQLDFALAKMRSNVPGADDEFEKALADAGFWGALRIEAEEGEGPSRDRLVARPLGLLFQKSISDATATKLVKKGTRDGRSGRAQ